MKADSKEGSLITELATVPAMLVTCEADGTILSFSQMMHEETGTSGRNVCGRSIFEFLDETSTESLKDYILKNLPLRERIDNFRLTVRKSDDSKFLALASLVQASSGILEIVFKNVDFLIDLETRLRTKRERLTAVLEATGAAIWAWNTKTNELVVNDRCAQIVGYEIEDLAPITKETWASLCIEEDLEREREQMARHLSGQFETYQGQVRLRHRNGSLVWVRIHGRVTSRSAQGEPEWVNGIFLDISDEVSAQTKLRRAEDTLEKASRLAGFGGWEADLMTSQIYWSPETCRLHNVPPGYVPSSFEEAYRFYPPEARARLMQAVERAVENGTGWDLELPFRPRGSEEIWVRTIGEVHHENDIAVRMSGAFQDITEHKKRNGSLALITERLSLAVMSGGIGVWEADIVTGELTFDDRMRKYFGLSGEGDWLIRDWIEALDDGSRGEFRSAMAQALLQKAPIDVCISTRVTGQIRSYQVSALLHEQDGENSHRLVGVCWDRTSIDRMTESIRKERTWLETSLSSIGDGVITADPDGKVIWMNPVAERLTGQSAAEAAGRSSDTVFRVINEVTGKPCIDPIADCLATRSVVTLEPNATLINKFGKVIAVDDSVAPILSDDGELLGAIMVFRDVSEQREHTRLMELHATVDQTTGLPNRRWFTASLSNALTRSYSDRESHFLLFCDLDNFKLINDLHGHAMGDVILRDVGGLLREHFNGTQTVARLGGDEFAVIVSGEGKTELRKRLEALCADVSRLADHHALSPEARTFGMSVGGVHLSDHFDNRADAMRAADAACYQAKRNGRGQVVFAGELTREELSLRGADDDIYVLLDAALAEDRLAVHFQEITHTDPHTKDAPPMVELLARLITQTGALLSAGEFIPIAERSGLVARLDIWMLRKALSLIETGRFGDRTIVSVNVSGASVGDEKFCRQALSLLATAGSRLAERVCLEITETVALHDPEKIALFTREVRKAGAKVALDDFGAGMSSIRHLNILSVDYLKLDGSLVREVCSNRLTQLTLGCFVDLATEIGAKTVAEFVETPEVRAGMLDLGVDFVQGYLTHTPESLWPENFVES